MLESEVESAANLFSIEGERVALIDAEEWDGLCRRHTINNASILATSRIGSPRLFSTYDLSNLYATEVCDNLY
jgi:hypothetical protein